MQTNISHASPGPAPTGDDPLAVAAYLAAGLYPHQVEGVAFLLRRGRAVLADDMGLGKTRQAIVALCHAAPAGPWLVVTPASVKHNWAREIELARPGAAVAVVGPEAPPEPGFEGFVIVNYDILHRHAEVLRAHAFAGLVFDEAHYLKNRESRRSRLGLGLVAAAGPRAPVYALTGTPLTNRPRDLFPLLALVGHPLGRSFLSFAKRYCAATHNGYGWVTDGASNLEELALEVRGVLLRRNKSEVLDLPPKLRSWLPVEVKTGGALLGDLRAVVTELVRSRARQRSGRPATDLAGAASPGADRSRLVARITRLRRRLAVAKVPTTRDLVEGAVAQGEKVLVFSCFSEPVKKLAEAFGDAALTIDGSTPTAKRQAIVDRFQKDEGVRVLVANIVAGGVGLNLTAARQVVFNDLDWVPANHWQAEDRAYRIGQEQTVNVHYVVANGTLDEFVREVLLAKAALVDAVIDGRALAADGDVLAALEAAFSALSPKLASLQAADLDEEELRAVLRELAVTQRGAAGEAAAAAAASPTLPQAAIDILARVLAGPAPTRYRVASSSRAGLWYDLEANGGEVLCACPGFQYRGTCSHARKLQAALARGGELPAGYAVAGAAS